MAMDFREDVAKDYDHFPVPFDDTPFYKARIPAPESSILELGCGTGRVLISLAANCGHILGVDNSEAMLAACREKLQAAGIPRERAEVRLGDIARKLALGRRFDLIIAPFRVFQALVAEDQIRTFFTTIESHLAGRGTCILNVFNPHFSKEKMATDWVVEGENFVSETPMEGGRLALFDRRSRMDADHQVIYPDLIFRRYRGEHIEEEVVLKLAMRYYYSQEFEALIVKHGFRIVNRWGGYAGELYGEGPELVIEFCP